MSRKLFAILDAAGLQADSVEEALLEIRDNFYLDTAEGAQLNVIGSIFGVDRQGRPDTAYRADIVVRAASFFSGTPEDIIQAVAVFLGGTYTRYIPVYPAGFTLITDGAVTKAGLEILAPAGVEVFLGDYIVDAVGDEIMDATGDFLVSVS